jgi:hypothetical protein
MIEATDELAHRTKVITNQYGSLVGKTIARVRPLTADECEGLGWNYEYNFASVIILTDGTALVPMCDAEGNGTGHILIASVIK